MLPLHFAAFASYPCLEPLLIANDDLSESVNKEDPLLDIQCADQDLRESVTREDPLPQAHGNSPNTDEDLRESANGDDLFFSKTQESCASLY